VTVVALVATIPAFYGELNSTHPPPWAPWLYLLAAGTVASAALQAMRQPDPGRPSFLQGLLDLGLVVGLLVAALLPASSLSQAALLWRLTVALLTLAGMVRRLQHLVTRGGVVYLMSVAFGVLLLCGVGFWWLEPRTPTLADGLWLAFTTAATVGYGDIVPSTPASRIFSVFVVLLGLGVLTLATAAIATSWIETGERRIEREILQDLHSRLAALHEEIRALRAEQRASTPPAPAPPRRPTDPDARPAVGVDAAAGAAVTPPPRTPS
jgi:voltage-gated potassium channel